MVYATCPQLDAERSAGLVHCNVTSSAIVWREDLQSWALTDLCFATPAEQQLDFAAYCMPLRHTAPEVALAAMAGAPGVPARESLDAWQLGLLGYEMMAGASLFADETPSHVALGMMLQQGKWPWEESQVRWAWQLEV